MREENANIVYIYYQAIDKYRKYMQKELDEHNLSPSEIDILTYLINNKEKKITAKDIGLHRRVSKGLISRSVNSLVEKNIIYTIKNEDDARSLYIEIVDEDIELIKDVENANKIFLDSIFKDIDKKEYEIFQKVNNKLLKNLDGIL